LNLVPLRQPELTETPAGFALTDSYAIQKAAKPLSKLSLSDS